MSAAVSSCRRRSWTRCITCSSRQATVTTSSRPISRRSPCTTVPRRHLPPAVAAPARCSDNTYARRRRTGATPRRSASAHSPPVPLPTRPAMHSSLHCVSILDWVLSHWSHFTELRFIFMAALCNRGAIIFLPCSFFLSIFFLSFFFFLA